MSVDNNVTKQHPAYLAFKAYIKFFHDKIYYRKTYTVNTEVIPPSGVPTLILSNHQNCLNDPLGILFSFTDRKAHFLTRADVFALSPIADKFLRSIGLLPSFRLNYEGLESLEKNKDTFRSTEKELVRGRTIVMYPEAGHQDKHWLGYFSLGYAKLAFEAAELDDFKTDIIILPSCNHYSNYFGIQNEFMVKYNTPIHLSDYYELYKQKPRTAQRELNKKVREQISSLMLNVEDLDNYEAIDYIREIFRSEWAKKQSMPCNELPDQLLVDKSLCARLEECSKEKPEAFETIYASALELKNLEKSKHIDDKAIRSNPSAFLNLLGIIGCALLSPLWIVSLWPGILQYWIPKAIMKAVTTDRMFEGTFVFALNVLFLIPIFYILTLVLIGIFVNWWLALIYVLFLPWITLFAWYWRKWIIRCSRNFRFAIGKGKGLVKKARDMRINLFDQLNKIL